MKSNLLIFAVIVIVTQIEAYVTGRGSAVAMKDARGHQPSLLQLLAERNRHLARPHKRSEVPDMGYGSNAIQLSKKRRPGSALSDFDALAELSLMDQMLEEELNYAQELANGIITDLRGLLGDIRSGEAEYGAGHAALASTIENALDPSDPDRLLRLS